jgi:hypothetical protein
MNEHDLNAFMLDIDKIFAGEPVVVSAGAGQDQEYQELLMLAQLLAAADFSSEDPEREERIWSKLHQDGRLADDELDLVAGGLNLDALLAEEEKKE